jgi:hypothetical protein
LAIEPRFAKGIHRKGLHWPCPHLQKKIKSRSRGQGARGQEVKKAREKQGRRARGQETRGQEGKRIRGQKEKRQKNKRTREQKSKRVRGH